MSDLPTGTVTFLFTDIEGSTRLLERLGERYAVLLTEHQRLLREAIGEAGGKEVDTEGDALFAVFETAPQAVACAVEAQRALAAHSWPDGEQVRVRMGLHTGEGRLGAGGYVGLDVHRAARISAAGHGGQVLLSASTTSLAEGVLPRGVTLRDLGDHRLKDLSRPEHLFQLLISELRSDFPQPRTLEAHPNNLPVQLTSFVGREREIDGLNDAVEASRLVTLTGPGGTGKTRLGLQVGAELLERFEHGVFFVSLAPISDPSLLASTIVHTLGLAEEGSRPALETLQEHLRSREMLLILDNFEQIVEAGSVAVEMLRAAPRLKILVTSRAGLHVSGENEHPVPPMELPDHRRLPPLDALSQFESVALFIQRAASVSPSFAVTNENARAVAEICARLDGLPLAIELAAARARVLAPQAILARLESRLALLTGGARDLPARQQTLRGTIDWSYDLLDRAERSLFCRLSVFVGGLSLHSAETVCNPEGELGMDTLDALTSLVDKSLIRQIPSDADQPRFRMLQVIREYGLERLGAAEEAEEIRERHARYFLELADRAEPHYMQSDQASWLDTIELDHDNLRSALEWLRDRDPRRALLLAAALWRFWQIRGYLNEGRRNLTELLALPGASEDPVVHAKGLEAAGGVVYWQGDFEAARTFYEEALSIHRQQGDRVAAAMQLYNISFTYSVPGTDMDRARELTEEALTIFREARDRSGEAKCLWSLGWTAFTGGDDEAVRSYLGQAEPAFRELRDPFSLAWTLHTLGMLTIRSGEYPAARRYVKEALSIFLDARDLSGLVLVLDDFSWLSDREGYRNRAIRLAAAAQRLERETGTTLLGAAWAPSGRPDPKGWLTDDAARAAWQEGDAMSLDEAVAYALKEPEAEG